MFLPHAFKGAFGATRHGCRRLRLISAAGGLNHETVKAVRGKSIRPGLRIDRAPDNSFGDGDVAGEQHRKAPGASFVGFQPIHDRIICAPKRRYGRLSVNARASAC